MVQIKTSPRPGEPLEKTSSELKRTWKTVKSPEKQRKSSNSGIFRFKNLIIILTG
jgi:hypothetical protein